jgi:hypothetical protein
MDEKVKSLLADIGSFVKWYSKKMNGAILPHSPESLATHWLAYLSKRMVKTDTTSLGYEASGYATLKPSEEIVPMVINRKLALDLIYGNEEKDNSNDNS